MWRFAFCVLLLTLFAGCADEESVEPDSSAGTPAAAASTSAAATTPVQPIGAAPPGAPELDRSRTTVAGNWVLAVVHPVNPQSPAAPRTEGPSLNVVITLDAKGAYQIQVKDTPAEMGQAVLESSEIDATKVRFVFTFPQRNGRIDFEGELKDGVVWGTTLLGSRMLLMSRLIALAPGAKVPPQGAWPVEGEQNFGAVNATSDPIPVLQEFVKQFPNSPLAVEAYQKILQMARAKSLDVATLEQAAEGYQAVAVRWGKRVERGTYLNSAVTLSDQMLHPELILKFLEKAATQLNVETEPGLKLALDVTREKANTLLALEQLRSGTDEQKQAALERLKQTKDSDPLILDATLALADHARTAGDVDGAIQGYAKVAALPMASRMLESRWAQFKEEHPLPKQTLAAIWAEKHGNTDEMEKFLDQRYDEYIAGLSGEKVQPRAEGAGNRVALLELFTGAECAPCIAADLAVAAVEAAYPPNDVIVLRYHMNIPGPDPLANEMTAQRFNYYFGGQDQQESVGTPVALLNGKRTPVLGNPNVSMSYRSTDVLKSLLSQELSQSSDIKVALSAAAEGDVIKISAEVSGLANPSPNHKLRLVLAEDDINFVAFNGIRRHTRIVRAMPGGFAGIAPQDGKLTFTGSVNLAELKRDLGEQLTATEQQYASQGHTVKFAERPMPFRRFQLVALVQDDEKGEVLQATVVPVSGLPE